MRIKLLNGLPLGAVIGKTVVCTEITLDEAKKLVDDKLIISYIGHRNTAAILTKILGKYIEFNRGSTFIEPGELILVCAYSGDRLPEGAVELPPGAVFKFFSVDVKEV